VTTAQHRDDLNELLADAARLVDLLSAHEQRLRHLSIDASLEARAAREVAETLWQRLASSVQHKKEDNARRPVVLVADDSDDNRELAALLLETAGFRAITARNGLEALIAADRTRPVVIVMDVAMPVLDGVQATRLLKANPATRDSRVIAYTAASLDGDGSADLFEAVLAKAGEPSAFLTVVRQLAGKPR
jgi:CheY-like chemotaxis protein